MIKELLAEIILEFIESGAESLSVPFKPIPEYTEAFKALGFTLEDYECYGWDAGFNYEVENPEGFRLALWGSLYYGTFTLHQFGDKTDYHFTKVTNVIR